jgi:hypothetical protein
MRGPVHREILMLEAARGRQNIRPLARSGATCGLGTVLDSPSQVRRLRESQRAGDAARRSVARAERSPGHSPRCREGRRAVEHRGGSGLEAGITEGRGSRPTVNRRRRCASVERESSCCALTARQSIDAFPVLPGRAGGRDKLPPAHELPPRPPSATTRHSGPASRGRCATA